MLNDKYEGKRWVFIKEYGCSLWLFGLMRGCGLLQCR